MLHNFLHHAEIVVLSGMPSRTEFCEWRRGTVISACCQRQDTDTSSAQEREYKSVNVIQQLQFSLIADIVQDINVYKLCFWKVWSKVFGPIVFRFKMKLKTLTKKITRYVEFCQFLQSWSITIWMWSTVPLLLLFVSIFSLPKHVHHMSEKILSKQLLHSHSQPFNEMFFDGKFNGYNSTFTEPRLIFLLGKNINITCRVVKIVRFF